MVRGAWLLAVLLVPLAAAATPDPLLLSWTAFPAPEGRLADDPPADASVHFPPSGPAAPAAPLVFAAPAPVSFRPEGTVRVTLVLAADQPLVARDADGAAVEVALLLGGETAATARMALERPVLAPGDRVTLAADLAPGNASVAEGAEVALHVRAVLPAVPEKGLRLVLGNGTGLAFPAMRAPDVAALRLQDAPLHEFLAAEGYAAPAGTRAVDVRVTHDRVQPGPLAVPQGAPAVVVLRGEEEPETAAQHAHANRTRRVEAAHELVVGTRLVRVHPGVGVVVPIGSGPGVVLLGCVRNCPSGTVLAIRFTDDAPPSVVTDDPGVLIPPPRATSGIPVSEDAEEKPTPWGPLGLAALALAAAATARRR